MENVMVLTHTPELVHAMRRVLRKENMTMEIRQYNGFDPRHLVVSTSHIIVLDAYEVLSAVETAHILRGVGFKGWVLLMGWTPAKVCRAVKTVLQHGVVDGFLVIPFDNGRLCKQFTQLLRTPAPHNL